MGLPLVTLIIIIDSGDVILWILTLAMNIKPLNQSYVNEMVCVIRSGRCGIVSENKAPQIERRRAYKLFLKETLWLLHLQLFKLYVTEN